MCEDYSASSIISSSLSSCTSSTLASCLAFTFFLLDAKFRLVSTSAISISPSSCSSCCLAFMACLRPAAGDLIRAKVPLHLFDIFGLLYFLGHFHPLEDVMCLPLVLDLLYSLHGIDRVLPKLTIVLDRNIPFLFKLKAGINSQLLAG